MVLFFLFMIKQHSIIQTHVLERWTADSHTSCSGHLLPMIHPLPCTNNVGRWTHLSNYPSSSPDCASYFVCAATISYVPSTIPDFFYSRYDIMQTHEIPQYSGFFFFNTSKAIFSLFAGRNCRQPVSAAKLKQTSLSEQKVLFLETQAHSLTPELIDWRFFSFWEIQFDNL